MKKTLVPALLVLLTLFFAACKKGNEKNTSYLTAKKGGVLWNGLPQTGFKPQNTTDTLVLHARSGEENIIIKLKLNGTGEYKPVNRDAFVFITVGLDAVTGKYILANVTTNKVTVISLDNKIIKGTFQLTFQKITSDNYYPATLVFSDGSFKADITNQYLNLDPIVAR